MPTDPPPASPARPPQPITRLRERTLKTVRRHRLVETSPASRTHTSPTRIVVGVSGGADSMALLHVLHSLCTPLNIELTAASLDHGLRGAAGAADVAFVRETAQAWGIAVQTGAADVAARAARDKLSTEAAARSERYAFLARVARETDAQTIAVAHHADDQAETVLMRLLRGTGTAGLAAMLPLSPVPEHALLRLIRPLLNSTRAEIEAYCAAVGVIPRHDASNEDTDFLRNRIRLEVMPCLQAINPQIARGLARVGESAAQDDAVCNQALAEQSESLDFRFEPGLASMRRDTFQQQPDGVQRRAILALMAGLGVHQDHDYEQIVAAVGIARNGRVGAVVLLAHGLRLRVARERIFVEAAILGDAGR